MRPRRRETGKSDDQNAEACVMQTTKALLDIYQKRGSEGLPLERVYRHLFDPKLFLRAYGKIYRNFGAMTRGTTEETVDGMSIKKIHGIIDLLKRERYRWTPVRRTEIPKPKGGTRPLGIPTWSDKLVQEVLRMLLESYYEPKFSTHSHGFRPKRSCHSALNEVRKTWRGTVWFIEGDIKGAFDNVDREVLLSIIQRDIHDGRLLNLIAGLLKAGYMEDWRYYDTMSGTPQGGIISPLLFNIYLAELDRWVEDALIPAYTRGDKRKECLEYRCISTRIAKARKRDNLDEVKRLAQERRKMMSVAPVDPDYRRLRYVRYADDFLLGFVGPKKEAEDIRNRLAGFLGTRLKLTLSMEKTLITHAHDEKATFLGYEITVTREGNLISDNEKRATNGSIALLMPQKVVRRFRNLYSKKGKIVHRADLLADTDYTILRRYQGVLKGIYNFYCMAVNVGTRKRMGYIKWILETSLTKTLAGKFKCKVTDIYRKYQVTIPNVDRDGTRKVLQVVIERSDKEPLVAVFGGFPIERRPDGLGTVDFRFESAWNIPANDRSEVVQRLIAGKCELCGVEDEPVEVHHIRKLADIDRPGRRPRTAWEKLMAARKRKTLVVCRKCHDDITYGRYDGSSL
jgi:group II intron reverse transcriptase/maturase